MNPTSATSPRQRLRLHRQDAATPTRSHTVVAAVVQVFSGSLLSQMMAGVVGLLVIRFMSEMEYARLTLAISLVAVVSQTVSAGFNRIYLVSCEELGLTGRVSEFLGLQLLALGSVVVLLLPTMGWLGTLYPLVATMFVARCLADYAQTIFQRELEFLRYSLVTLGQSLVVLMAIVGVLVCVGGGLKAWHVLAIQSTALLLVFLLNIAPRVSMRRLWSPAEAGRLTRTLLQGRQLYLFVYFALLAVFAQIDVWVLRATSDDLAVATYGTAYRYFTLLMLALTAVHAVLLPHVQRVQDVVELDAIFAKHRSMVAVFVPVVLFGAWASQWIMVWIDQGRYPQAVPVFWVLAGMAIVSFTLSPYVNQLLRAGDFRFLVGAVGVVLPLHGVCCWWLTVTLGVCGTAMAAFVGYGLLNSLVFLRARALRRHWIAMGERTYGMVIAERSLVS